MSKREVKAVSPVGTPALAHPLPTRHRVADHDVDPVQERVAGPYLPAMVDGHREIVDHETGKRHGSHQHGGNGGARRHCEIHPPVPGEPGSGGK